jgi:hypothetical protein
MSIDLKECKNCSGNGGFEIGVPCSPDEVMWVSDGELMTLGWKDCYCCKGSGKVTDTDYKKFKEWKKQNDI